MYQSLGLSPRLGLLKSEARPKPVASPCQGPARLGLERARLSGLRAWGPAQHITTFGSIIRLGQYCRTCFEPLAIYTMSFRPFPIIYNVFMEFPMFAHLYLTYCYIDGLSMHSPYYSILIRCVPDILWLCFDFVIFGDIDILMFQLFIVLADCTITIGSDFDP